MYHDEYSVLLLTKEVWWKYACALLYVEKSHHNGDFDFLTQTPLSLLFKESVLICDEGIYPWPWLW